MGDIFFPMPNKSTVDILIEGKLFAFSAYFSIADLEAFYTASLNCKSSREIFSAMLYEKGNKVISESLLYQLCLEVPEIFDHYIDVLAESDKDFQKFYLQTDTDLCRIDRLSIACQQYYIQIMGNATKEQIKAQKLFDRIHKSLGGALTSFQPVLQVAQNALPGMSSALLEYSSKMTTIASPAILNIQQNIAEYTRAMTSIIENIGIPFFSEEDKKRLVECYQEWGKLGWTQIPHAPLKFFNSSPYKYKSPDKVATGYCKSADMKELFSEMETQLNHRDLHAAIRCYTQKEYKACALLLFSIIDAKLVRNQPKDSNRKTGFKAVKQLRQEFDRRYDNEELFLFSLDSVNLFACLDTMFYGGDNFKENPAIINRNYIAHGMERRPVRKRDCIQVFLALYNLLLFLERKLV